MYVYAPLVAVVIATPHVPNARLGFYGSLVVDTGKGIVNVRVQIAYLYGDVGGCVVVDGFFDCRTLSTFMVCPPLVVYPPRAPEAGGLG